MVASNERGRAFEWAVRNEILDFAKFNGLKIGVTAHTTSRDTIEKGYFDALDSATQQNFISGAKAFTMWIEQKDWFICNHSVCDCYNFLVIFTYCCKANSHYSPLSNCR